MVAGPGLGDLGQPIPGSPGLTFFIFCPEFITGIFLIGSGLKRYQRFWYRELRIIDFSAFYEKTKFNGLYGENLKAIKFNNNSACKEFIDKYFCNNALNTVELANILPIYIK